MNRFLYCLLFIAFLFLAHQQVNAQISISKNYFQVYNGDNITLSTTNLNTYPSNVTYSVKTITESRFLLNGAETESFTSEDISNGRVIFSHNGNQEMPSFTLNVYSPSLNSTIELVGNIYFSAFRRNSIGAPRPVFYASINPGNKMITLRIRMFKKFSTPEVKYNLGLSANSTCQQKDLLGEFSADGITSTYWYTDYSLYMSLNDFINHPQVKQKSYGSVVDFVAIMHAEYMITSYPPPVATSQGDVYLAPAISGTCYKVIYEQKYCLTLVLELTRVSFNVTDGLTGGGNPNPCVAYIQPKKIFINDQKKLEIKMIVFSTLPNANTWSISGPRYFNVSSSVSMGGPVSDFYPYEIVLESSVIYSPIDFYGEYVLTYSGSEGPGCSITFSLQYLVPYPPIHQILQYNTTATTYADPDLSNPKNQFSQADIIYVKVDHQEAPTVPGKKIGPYNVIMCCFLNVLTTPVDVDCRNVSNADFSGNIFVNGVPVLANNTNAANLLPVSTQYYGFQFELPSPIQDTQDRRCFLTIESAYLSTNTTSVRSLYKKEENAQIRSLFQNPTANTVVSKTYRILDIIPKSTKGGTGPTGPTSGGSSTIGIRFEVVVGFLVLSILQLGFFL